MPQLTLDGGEAFSIGLTKFLDKLPDQEQPTPKIYVRIEAGEIGSPFLALVDTGAAWSCVDREIAEEIGILDPDGERTALLTAWGKFEGLLVRAKITILAEEGDSLEIEGTVFVPTADGWPVGRLVLGYGGGLDRMRFAVDAQRNEFYFGPSAGQEAVGVP